MSCGKHTTRRQAHATRRAKHSHTVRKAAHNAARQSTTNIARKATSARAAHRQVRAISKTRPKAHKHPKSPRKHTKRKLSAAQLKARNRRHRILSRRARAHARAVAQAKARANVKAAASWRAAHKSARAHAKGARFYCRVNIRGSALVAQPVPPGAKWSLRARKNAVRGLKYNPVTPGKPGRAIRAARAPKKK
jgi:hypothetical protein